MMHCVLDQVKGSMEQHRMSQAMKGMVSEQNPEADETELRLRKRMEQEKLKYTCTLLELQNQVTSTFVDIFLLCFSTVTRRVLTSYESWRRRLSIYSICWKERKFNFWKTSKCGGHASPLKLNKHKQVQLVTQHQQVLSRRHHPLRRNSLVEWCRHQFTIFPTFRD